MVSDIFLYLVEAMNVITQTYQNFYFSRNIPSEKKVCGEKKCMNYYPFGLKHKGYNNVVSSNGNSVAQRFGFIGKELNQELGLQWHDFGARNFDAALGRWMNIDPKANQFYDWSPYNYSYNSPLFFIDPDGKSPISMILKQAAKVGLKKAMKSYIKSSIKKRLKNYGSKKWGKQLLKDASDALDGLDSAWWEHAIEIIPVAGDAYGAASLTKKGVKVWNKLKKFEKLADNATTIAGKALKKVDLDFSKLTGKGADALEAITKKVNNISGHLKADDLVGAVKDIFGQPVTIGGRTFDHLGEVNDALKGLGNQLKKLNKLIDKGDVSDDVLKAAKSLRKQLQGQKDQIQNVLNRARRQAQ